ncbi:MAG: phosphoribosyl-ATP diphosphatase [Spirochaetales bacterium]|nr:phosphoribosyl-ATP diphosphatase [Spirochaetales bacterium]
MDPDYSKSLDRDSSGNSLLHSKISILNSLEVLLLQRLQELPEGSYTTHLFSSGAEKIRKKTGEEAIELILAPGRDEIIYESADLIYHMLVLLVSEGIALDEVLGELERRTDKG